MKTTLTTLSVALAVSLLAVETQAGKPQYAGSAGRASLSTGRSFQQGNSTLKSSGQLLVKHNAPNGTKKLGPLNATTTFKAAAVKGARSTLGN